MFLGYLILVFLLNNIILSSTAVYTVNGGTKEYYIISEKTISVVNYDGKKLKKVHVPSEEIENIQLFSSNNNIKFFSKKNNQLQLISVGGGMVYESINDTLKRIDNSFNHKMAFGSHVFKRNDTIFKFGGYGYWSSRNFLTFYSKSTREWEYYPHNSELTPPGISYFTGFYSENQYFVSDGKIVDKKVGSNGANNTEVWKFDFITKKWTNLGVANIPRLKHELTTRVNNDSFIGQGVKDNNLYLINFKKNTYKRISRTNTSFAVGYPHNLIVNDSLFNYKRGQVIYTSLKDFMRIDEKNLNDTKPIYLNSSALFGGLYNAAVVSVGLISFIIVFLRYRRNQLPRISELGIRHKGISYDINPKERLILLEIISNAEVTSQKMYDIIEDTDLSYPQNNKIKNDTIRKLNKKLYKILRVSDFIKSRKLDSDQRVIMYYSDSRSLFIN